MGINDTEKPYNTVEFMVHGNYALFSDILTRIGGEKMSYPIPTYEALKGILHSVYWKPTLVWIIDEVRIMNPIQYFRKGMRPLVYKATKNKKNDLAYYTYLTDVCYQVRAHFEWNLNRPELAKDRKDDKHYLIAKRMIERGGRRDIFLGTRECQGYVEPCKFGTGVGAYDNSGIIQYSLMEHGFTYPDEAVRPQDKNMLTVRLWKPTMNNGYIRFIRPEECQTTRAIKPMKIKKFDDKNLISVEETLAEVN